MTTPDFWQSRFPLEGIERRAKEYFEQTGSPLPYEKYLYLLRHSSPLPELKSLETAKARREQQKLAEQFHQVFYQTGRLDGSFLPEEMDLSVERLHRYVEIPTHSHSFIEFACVLSGQCHHTVDGNDYLQQSGSIAYVNAEVGHQLSAIGDAICLTIKVRREFFLALKLPNATDYVTPVMFQCGDDPFFRQLVLGLWEQSCSERPYQNRVSTLLFEALLTYVAQNYRDTKQRMYFAANLEQHIMRLFDYIIENSSTVTLRSMAAHFHYGESYLSAMLHRKTGKTFSQLLREYRLEHAAQLLRETDKPLFELCAEVGYSDPSQFIHIFKERYHTTPIQYRKQERGGK